MAMTNMQQSALNTISMCPICDREIIPGQSADTHHLLPKSRGTRDKTAYSKENLIAIHLVCHMKVHHTFSENELYSYYNTPERIKEHPEIQKFIKWVSKKDPTFIDKHKDTKDRKQKRKR